MSASTLARREELAADGAVSIAEARAFLGNVAESYLYTLMKRGELAFVHVGRRRLIPRRALVAYVANRMTLAVGEDTP